MKIENAYCEMVVVNVKTDKEKWEKKKKKQIRQTKMKDK